MKKQLCTQRDNIETARILSEALPHIRRHDNETIVIKLGGHAMSSDAALDSFARDIVMLHQCNLRPVIVHGGGPMITDMLNRLNIPSEFKDGKRISTAESVAVVEMVLSGTINKRIACAINAQGGAAVGLSGKDANLIMCRQLDPALGLVGEPTQINAGLLNTLAKSGYIPVISPLGMGADGQTFNINGDTAAGAIASGLGASRLLLLTDVAGVKDAKGQLLTQMKPADVIKLTKAGVIKDGMIPKTETVLKALENGLKAAVIVDGRVNNVCLLELFTNYGAGTMIRS